LPAGHPNPQHPPCKIRTYIKLFDLLGSQEGYVEACRADLGDANTGARGANRRPAGHVENARPLAPREEDYPYIAAMYDLPDIG